MERVVGHNSAGRTFVGLGRLRAGFVFMLVLLGLLLSFPKAFADKFNTELSDDVRNLGMGTAGINTSRGPYSVFYNPANIASKDTGTNIELVNFQFDMPGGMISGLAGGDTGVLNFPSLGSMATAAQKNPNTFEGGRYSIYPNVTFRNFSVGLLYEVNQGAIFDPTFGNLRVLARDRVAPVAALSERFFGGILRLGVSAQYVTVGNSDASVQNPGTSSLDYKQFIDSVSGLSLNAGTTVTLPFRFLPSFSVVARDIGNTRYTTAPLVKFGDISAPFTQPNTYDVGSSLTFLLGRRLEMKYALDYHDLTNKMEGGRFRHVFTGTEFIFYDIIKLRAGLAHGYPSAGFGVNTPKASLDFAVYTDELDDRLRANPETRYVMQYTWRLFK